MYTECEAKHCKSSFGRKINWLLHVHRMRSLVILQLRHLSCAGNCWQLKPFPELVPIPVASDPLYTFLLCTLRCYFYFCFGSKDILWGHAQLTELAPKTPGKREIRPLGKGKKKGNVDQLHSCLPRCVGLNHRCILLVNSQFQPRQGQESKLPTFHLGSRLRNPGQQPSAPEINPNPRSRHADTPTPGLLLSPTGTSRSSCLSCFWNSWRL